MNRDLLEEISQSKKKNDMSVARKREFRIELEKALKEDGITTETEKYIFNCASIGSGISFFNWIKNMDEVQVNELYTKLINTKGFRENANMNSSRVLLTLIVVAMGEDKKFSYVIADAIRKVPGLLLTKDGKMGANANKIIIFNFIEYVGIYKKWFSLSELELSEIERKQFISIIFSAMADYKPKNEDQRYSYKNLAGWIKNETSRTQDDSLEVTDKMGTVEASEEEYMPPQGNTENSPVEKSEGQNKLEFSTEKKSIATKKLLELAAYVDGLEKENDRMKEDLSAIQQEKNNLQSLYDRAKNNIQDKEEDIERLSTVIEETRKELGEKEKRIGELEVSIQKQSDVYSIYSTDSESRHVEKMNAIAARLKGEYKDFLESKDMEMTIDLGLNLRDQLEDVFNILMSNGIDIKGR